MILCPFAVYYLRYAVRSFFIISRNSAEERDKKKVQCKIAVAVQNVKPLYFLSRSFALSPQKSAELFYMLYNQIDQGAQTEGLERED